VDVAQTGVEIDQMLEHLHSKNGIKLGVAIGCRRNIRVAAFDPGELGASLHLTLPDLLTRRGGSARSTSAPTRSRQRSV
jgi:hypothetical protein